MNRFRNLFAKKKEEKKSFPLYLYSEEELNEYEAYIQKSLGHYDQVFHEIVSPDIHLDVIFIPPDEEEPYYKLVTMGAGAYRMNVPEEMLPYTSQYAEYVICLPQEWNLHSPDENDYWPLRALKNTARLPLNADTWLGYGHTVSHDAENTPFADNVMFTAVMLIYAADREGNTMDLELSGGKKLNFFQLIPIFPEELAFKQAHGADELLERLAVQHGFPIIDIHRKNTAE